MTTPNTDPALPPSRLNRLLQRHRRDLFIGVALVLLIGPAILLYMSRGNGRSTPAPELSVLVKNDIERFGMTLSNLATPLGPVYWEPAEQVDGTDKWRVQGFCTLPEGGTARILLSTVAEPSPDFTVTPTDDTDVVVRAATARRTVVVLGPATHRIELTKTADLLTAR